MLNFCEISALQHCTVLVIVRVPNPNRKSQLDTLRLGMEFPKSHWPLSFSASKLQRFKSQRLQDANATKSQTLAFNKSQRFSATKLPGRSGPEPPKSLRESLRGLCFRNSFAPYSGQNPQNREKWVPESKNPHFPPPQKRGLRVKNSPFSL